jgi:FtsZ-binding cell division protein ZapB
MFVAVGTSQGSDIMYSYDGINWTVTSTGTSSPSWTSVIWSDALNAFALVGTSGTTLLSSGFFAQFEIGDNITANTRTYDAVDSTSSSTGALVISGGVGISGNLNVGQEVSAASFNATSDMRVKSNIVSVHIHPEYSVDGLKPVSYFNDVIGRKDIGFIAQDVEEIYPFMVNENSDGYKSLSYTSIIGLLVKEIQILKSEVKDLKGDLQDLKCENQTIKGEVKDLKQKVDELQGKLDSLSSRIAQLSNKFSSGSNSAQLQYKSNTSGLGNYLSDLKSTNEKIQISPVSALMWCGVM